MKKIITFAMTAIILLSSKVTVFAVECPVTNGSHIRTDSAYIHVDPTCTQYGYHKTFCPACNYTFTYTNLAPLGHSWKAATCTTPMTCTRTNCGATSGTYLSHAMVYDSVKGIWKCTRSGCSYTMKN